MALPVLLSWLPWREDEESEIEVEEEISDKELRKKAYKAEQEIQQLNDQIEDHREKYKQHLKKGANAPEHRRRILAIKARMQKFKGQLRQIERKKSIRNLMQLELKRGEQEVQDLAEEVGAEGEKIVEEIEIDEEQFQENIMDAQADIQADMEEAQEMMESLQMPDGNFEMGTSEEEKLMEDLAKGEAEPEEIDIGTPTASDTTDETEDWEKVNNQDNNF